MGVLPANLRLSYALPFSTCGQARDNTDAQTTAIKGVIDVKCSWGCEVTGTTLRQLGAAAKRKTMLESVQSSIMALLYSCNSFLYWSLDVWLAGMPTMPSERVCITVHTCSGYDHSASGGRTPGNSVFSLFTSIPTFFRKDNHLHVSHNHNLHCDSTKSQ